MSNAYLYRMPSGIPGAVSREENKTIESVPFDSTTPFAGFGLFGKIASGKLQPVGAGDLASAIYGLLLRPYPANNSQEALGTAVPPTTGIANVLRRGYATVKINAGTAALNSPVYLRVSAPSGAKVVGGLEAAADTTVAGVAGSNTGNGTIGSLTSVAPAQAGVYVAKFTAATVFYVVDPNGVRLRDGATGVAYSDQGLGFTITAGGTAFVAGDSFNVTVTQNVIQVAGATFMGAADASGNAEIAYNI